VLRSVLRQDPDVILVGEIRDRETAEIAFQAAQTGHLVLSTLHTNDAVATVTRLFELGVEPQVMAPSLLAVVAQRLVRKVCLGCGESVEADEEARRVLHLAADKPLRAGRGCAACRNTGYSGRSGCYEVLRMTKPLQQLIEQKSPETTVRAVADDEGMTPLFEDARAKIVSGITTPAEVLRVVEVVSRGPSCPSCHNPVEASFSVCPFCRAALRKNCSGCGVELKKKWTACPFCGVEVAAPASAPRPIAAVAHTERVGAFEVPKILAVDDDPDVLELVRLTLKRSGFPLEIDTAGGGKEALAKVAANRPHLVILDLMMPGMDGYEVCRQLRSGLGTALIPVLMLTALADSDSKRLAFLAGTDDYVVKPFDLSELQARVQRLLERTYGWTPSRPQAVAAQARAPREPRVLAS